LSRYRNRSCTAGLISRQIYNENGATFIRREDRKSLRKIKYMYGTTGQAFDMRSEADSLQHVRHKQMKQK